MGVWLILEDEIFLGGECGRSFSGGGAVRVAEVGSRTRFMCRFVSLSARIVLLSAVAFAAEVVL